MNDDFGTTPLDSQLVLPAQMPWGARCNADTSGVRALMLAILEDAMRCVERGRGRRYGRTRRQAAEAGRWLRSDCRAWLFSFASICDVLGIDADAFRIRLLADGGHPANGGLAPHAERLVGVHREAPRRAGCSPRGRSRRPIDEAYAETLSSDVDVAQPCPRCAPAESDEPVPRRGMHAAAGRRASMSSRA